MADNGKIIRNGAEIQIDENGNVVARPAEGQEFIVEDDARVGTLEAGFSNTDDATDSAFNGFGIGDNQATFSRDFPRVNAGETLRIRLEFDSSNRTPLSALVDISSNDAGSGTSYGILAYYHGMMQDNSLGSGSSLSDVIASSVSSIDSDSASIEAVGSDNQIDLLIENTSSGNIREGNRFTVHLNYSRDVSLIGVDAVQS